MAYLLVKDGQLVIRDGTLVTVPNATGNGDCECCGDVCADCSGTQGSVTASFVGGGDTCGTGTPCRYIPASVPWLGFTSDSTWCVWTWKYDNYATGDPINPFVDFFVVLVYNHTTSTQTWPTGCSASVPAGQFYLQANVTPHGGGSVIRWNKLNPSVSCSGGELSFADTLTQCFNNWVACVCGTIAVSK